MAKIILMRLTYLIPSNIQAIEIWQGGEKYYTEFIQDGIAGDLLLPVSASFKLIPRNEAEPFSAEIRIAKIAPFIETDSSKAAKEAASE